MSNHRTVQDRNTPSVVRVGVAALVVEGGRALVLRRKGSHGSGTWGLPGGHQEFGESPAETAVREVEEETGLQVVALEPLGFSDDQMLDIGKHYVTLFIRCKQLGGTARIMEPDKASEIAWLTPAELLAMDTELFSPLRNFLATSTGLIL